MIEEVIKDRTPYIFGRLCSEKETPTNGTQTLAQTLLYSDSVHEILQSNLLQSQSYRRRKSKIRHSHNRTKAYIFGCLCSEQETPTSGTQILAQTLLYNDSVHEILQSNLLQSENYRRQKSKIGHSHNRTKAFLS